MKRVNNQEPSFKVKPYISKRTRKADETIRTETEENIDLSSSSNSKLLKSSNIKCGIPKHEVAKRKEHSNVVTSIQWNERKTNCLASSSLDKSLLLWDLSYSKLSVIRRIQVHAEGLKDVKWTKDGVYLLTASFDKSSKLIDAEKGTCLQVYNHVDLVSRVCWHPNNSNLFISGTANSGVFAWDVRQKKAIKTYKSCFGQVQDILFLRDGKTFLTSAEVLKKNSMDQTIMAWDFDTTAVLSNQIYQEPYACTSLKIHPNERSVLAQSSAGYIVIFDDFSPWKMNKYKRYGGHKSAGYHIGFDISVDGKIIYCGDSDGHLFVYNNHTSKILMKLKPFTSPLVNVAFSPTNESRIALSSWDGEVAIFE